MAPAVQQGAAGGSATVLEILGPPMTTAFTHHLGERLHVATFARPSAAVAHLALTVQRGGGVLNVLGSRNDVLPVPPEFKLDENFQKQFDFKFAYGGAGRSELGYRKILFKRLLFLWRLSMQLPSSDLLLFIDGNDVLFQKPLDDLVSTWKDMVGGAERGAEPVIFNGLAKCGSRFTGDAANTVYPLPASPRGLRGAAACGRWAATQPRGTYPFLDTGAYMGRAGVVGRVLQEALAFAHAGLDYICMSTVHVAGLRLGPSRVRVDTEARLFYNLVPRRTHDKLANWTPEVARPLCQPGYFDKLGQPPTLVPTGTAPAVLHFPGGSKWYWLSACMSAFRRRRHLELAGLGAASAPNNSTPAAAAEAAEGSLAAGFANASVRLCFFNDEDCEPCSEDRPDCRCITCQTFQDTLPYFDVDQDLPVGIPLSTLLHDLER